MDYYLVGVLSMGPRGAAIATILSQGFSAALCFLYLMRFHREFMFKRPDMHISGELLRKTCSLAFVTGLHQTGLYIGKMLVQCAVNISGADMIAAYTATTRIEAFINSFGDSGAAATSILVAQSYGAGDRERVQTCFRRSLQILLLFGILMSLILFFTAAPAARLLLRTREGEAFQNAVRYGRPERGLCRSR
jgi:Na+-driven multidrug efflux pump